MGHIIHRIDTAGQPAWQKELADAVRDPAELLRQLQLPDSLLPQAQRAAKQFLLRVPDSFVRRMRIGDERDPLLLQVLPHHLELTEHPGFVTDPVGDAHARKTPGVLQKYQGRALFITTGACAIHCRYCFRRHYPYQDSQAGRDQWQSSINFLRSQNDISEVILSGGDPLSLSDQRLEELIEQLEAIQHLRYLRIHTRLPIVIPNRVSERLLSLLSECRLNIVVVLHSNHPQEIDQTVRHACQRLGRAGATLLNQAVLLRGINDDISSLRELSERLFDCGVLPYYLHQLDRVAGAAHFEVEDETALALVEKLRQQLPGYLVPRLVREIAGEPYKTPLQE